MDPKAAASQQTKRQRPRQMDPAQNYTSAEVAAFKQIRTTTHETHLGSWGTSAGFSLEVAA